MLIDLIEPIKEIRLLSWCEAIPKDRFGKNQITSKGTHFHKQLVIVM